jgi:hypothetical protein
MSEIRKRNVSQDDSPTKDKRALAQEGKHQI